VAVYPTTDSYYYDAQTYPDFSFQRSPSGYPSVLDSCAINTSGVIATQIDYYVCNYVTGLDLSWFNNQPALTEQVIFFNLGTPISSEGYDDTIYGAINDDPSSTQQSSNYAHGQANGAWEIEFNCATGSCSNGASLEWAGTLYSASAEVLTQTSGLNGLSYPSGGAYLNEFVYNVANGVGELYPPPGWVSWNVTSTALNVSASTVSVGTSVTFQATVTGNATPTGTVTFSSQNGALPNGTQPLNSSGIATLSTSTLTAGTYTITAVYNGDSANLPSPVSASQSLTVSAPPTVTISVAPTAITLGQQATLTWSSTNATSCSAGNAWSGSQPLTGSLTLSPTAAGALTYTLACAGPGGSTSMSTTLTVNAPPSVSLSVAPLTITVGQTATLSWSTTNASACTASNAWSGSEPVSGSFAVTPTTSGSATYILTCSGPGGSGNASATLTVNAAAAAASSSGGGGGAIGLLDLLGLGALGLAQLRKRRHIC
jgi:hypothetical protein